MSWAPDNEENPFGDPSIDEARKANTSTVSPRESSMNANHTPSWIEDVPQSDPNSSSNSGGSGYTPPHSSFPVNTASTRDSQMASQNQNNNQSDPSDPGQAPSLVVYMRVSNLVASIMLITFCVLSFIPPVNPSSIVICCYLICFGCLLCCFEMRIRQVSTLISKNLGFMFSWQSRCLFLIFVAILCLAVGTILLYIGGGIMLVIALFNAYVLYKFPQHSASRPIDYKQAATGAAIDYAKNNPDAVQAGVKAGIDHAKKNPEQVKQGVDSWI